MLPIFKKGFVLLFFTCLLFSCTFTQEGKQERELIDKVLNTDAIPELSPRQASSFAALNKIQVSTDEKNRFYSTFAALYQPCYPPDTNVVITQAELLIALSQFVEENCTKLSIETRDSLSRTAVLAQEEYSLAHCKDNLTNVNYKNGIPMVGTWVLPSVLGRRDIIIEW